VKQKHPKKTERNAALSGEKIAVILIAVVVGALLFAAAVIGIVTLVGSNEEESSTKDAGGSFSDLFTEDYETEGDFRYTVQNGTASVYQYMGSDTAVTVPETLGGYVVTELSAYSFIGNEHITSVTLPKSILFIGTDAFGDAPLSTVTYGGAEEEWNAVVVENPNTALLGAKLIYSDKSN
jgi:hypothetical protein